MALTQRERDRLDVLKQAKRKQITQKKAAERMGVSERWVRKLLQRMKTGRDRVVVHKLRGRPSNRRLSGENTRSDREDSLRSDVRRLWTHAGEQTPESQTPDPHRPRSAAPVDDTSGAVASAAAPAPSHPHLARAPRSFRRTGAMGQFHARLAGRPRAAAQADPHDRRRHQPFAAALCGARCGGGKPAPAKALAADLRPYGDLLYRQSRSVSLSPPIRTGW